MVVTHETEARQAAIKAAPYVRIVGSVTLTNEHDGRYKTFRVKPFFVKRDTPWVDIVDAAVEQVTPETGSWTHEGSEHLGEVACASCVDRILNGGFGPAHVASRGCRSGRHAHCTCDTCF